MGWLRLSRNLSADARRRRATTLRGALVGGLVLTLATIGVLAASAAGPAPKLLAAAYDSATGVLALEVSGADPNALNIRIDGQPAAATGLTATPIRSQGSVVLTIETSSSTAGNVLAREKAVARAIIEALPPGVQVGIVTFGDAPATASPLGTDRAATLAALDALTTGTASALYDGVRAAAAVASGAAEPRSIVLMTYGWHFGSNRVTRGESIDAAAAGNATVHALAFGSDFDSPYLQALASTGGSFDARPDAPSGAALAPGLAGTVLRVQIPMKLQGGAHTVTLGDGPAASALQFSVAATGTPSVPPSTASPGGGPLPESSPEVATPSSFSGWAPVFSSIGLLGALGTAYLLLRTPASLRRTRPALANTPSPGIEPDPTPPPPSGPQGPGGGERAPVEPRGPVAVPTTREPVSRTTSSTPTSVPGWSLATAWRTAWGTATAWRPAASLSQLRWPTSRPRVPTVAPGAQAPIHIPTEGRITRGLRRLNLGVRYQPVFSIETGELVGAEALLRAESDTAASMTARAVVRRASEQGHMPEITQLVVGDACRVAALMTESGPRDFRVSVNVSVEQLLDRGFTSTLRTALGEARLAPSQLAIEVAEHGLIENPRAVAVLSDAALLGVRAVVDDYWASDPALLAQLPSGSSVKVDVSRVGGNARAEQELRRVVETARAASMPVTAKRVESREDRAFALSLGCEFAQGNQFSEPVTGAQLLAIAAPLAELNRIADSFVDHSDNGGDGTSGARRVA